MMINHGPLRCDPMCLRTSGRSLVLQLCLLAVFGLNVQAATLFEYYAKDWEGPGNNWTSKTGTHFLFYDTWGGSAPQKGSSTIAGVPVATAFFDGNDYFTSPFTSAGSPWAGLKEFSLSLVFKSGAAGQNGVNDFWQQRGIVGFERGGVGQGEFAIGIWSNGVAGSTGLGSGDNGTSAGNINDNNWHTMSLVVKQENLAQFSQTVFVNGNQIATSGLLDYGSIGALAAGGGDPVAMGLGAIRGSDAEKFVGEVAALRFDDEALTASLISSLHSDYLGVIPEPSTSLLMGIGALSLLVIRRRRAV